MKYFRFIFSYKNKIYLIFKSFEDVEGIIDFGGL